MQYHEDTISQRMTIHSGYLAIRILMNSDILLPRKPSDPTGHPVNKVWSAKPTANSSGLQHLISPSRVLLSYAEIFEDITARHDGYRWCLLISFAISARISGNPFMNIRCATISFTTYFTKNPLDRTVSWEDIQKFIFLYSEYYPITDLPSLIYLHLCKF